MDDRLREEVHSMGRQIQPLQKAKPKNMVAGTWQMVSATADLDGEVRNLFGLTPAGCLIYTEDLHFAVVINDPTVPHFASSNRAEGTTAENRAAIAGALGLYGTYTIDDEGRFASAHVVGSTFPNLNGLNRTTATLTESVDGDRMVEHLHDPGGPKIEIIWQRAR
jgi:hypothetical protein